MNISWTKSPSGRRVLEHWADSRPSWLWSQDGRTLLWRNTAARFFQAKPRKGDSAASDEVMPIRGQVARLIRLGSFNRASLSRMQFLAGDRAVSVTCACTPLNLPEEQTGLLVVSVDPIEATQPTPAGDRDAMLESILPPGSDYLLIDQDGLVGGSPVALERYAPTVVEQGMPPLDAEGNGRLDVGGQTSFTAFKASPQGASLLLFDATAGAATEPVVETAAQPESSSNEPMLPLDLPALPAMPQAPVEANEAGEEALPTSTGGGLASLFDRLMDDSALFSPLSADEDFIPPPSEPAASQASAPEPVAEPHSEALAPTHTGTEPEAAVPPVPMPDVSSASEAAAGDDAQTLYQVTGRQFAPLQAAGEAVTDVVKDSAADAASAGDSEARRQIEGNASAKALMPTGSAVAGLGVALLGTAAIESHRGAASDGTVASMAADVAPLPGDGAENSPDLSSEPTTNNADVEKANPSAAASVSAAPETTDNARAVAAEDVPATDPESVERVSRYNFDELSRILTDRVGTGESEPARAVAFGRRVDTPTLPSAAPSGALVTLGGETLVLNRLPLGILVFREQQMLFANRAITEMTGYESVEALRTAGLGAIFSAGDEQHDAGPVNHLVQRDGTMVPVTARLQSVSWQGKPALMLSASATEVRTGHEAAVKAFAEHLANARADGFFETSRAGIIAYVSGDARLILKRQEEQLLGRPVSGLLAPGEIPNLRQFFERPARFAETARPAITLKGVDRGLEIMLFAQGQAGIISGYFGFVRQTESTGLPAIAAPQGDTDPALLTRLSRGVRRPLNTVIGFSDLIGSAAFGEIENERYVEYARDIKTAGLEIAALVDELDDFARLRDGRYAARPSEIDLAVLLDSTVMRVRGQANAARVLVRSAISERLPRVRADRASLSQAILNLLASAIDQTPQDSAVVLSAQADDVGGVTINVRDSAHNIADLGERFVVFRDGVGRDGQALTPIRSSVGLALTRALLEVNQANLNVDPAGSTGTMFSIAIPAEAVVESRQLPTGPTPESTS